jgi:hypothetical protein
LHVPRHAPLTPPLRAPRAAERAAAAPQIAHTPSGTTVTIDDWLIDFANLFRDTSGLDADRHIDFHNAGWDATTRAMEAGVPAPEAGEMFAAAADQFRDVTCTGLLNWWVLIGAGWAEWGRVWVWAKWRAGGGARRAGPLMSPPLLPSRAPGAT